MFGALSIPPEIKRDAFEGQDHGSGTLSLNIMYLAWENVSVAWKGVRFICISFSKHSNYLWNTVDDRVEFYLKQNGKSCKCSRRDLLLLAGPRGPELQNIHHPITVGGPRINKASLVLHRCLTCGSVAAGSSTTWPPNPRPPSGADGCLLVGFKQNVATKWQQHKHAHSRTAAVLFLFFPCFKQSSPRIARKRRKTTGGLGGADCCAPKFEWLSPTKQTKGFAPQFE